MYVINHSKKYLIYMYPKSGCSTLRVLHAYLSHPVEEHEKKNFEDAHHGIQRRDDDILKRDWAMYKDYCKVLVYRDPYARVVSLFFQKVCGVPAVTYGGELYVEPVRLTSSMRTFAQFVSVLITKQFQDDEHFLPQKMFQHPDYYDQVLEICDVKNIFKGIKDDLHAEITAIMSKTKKQAWNQLEKVEAAPGKYAHYDFLKDAEGFLAQRKVPCKEAMLTPEICSQIQHAYGDDFAFGCSCINN